MKNLFPFSMYACLMTLVAFLLVACDDDVSSAAKDSDDEISAHMVDTLYVYSKDTVVIRDSVFASDTVVVRDSVILKDTVYVMDSLIRNDSSCVMTDLGVSLKIQCGDRDPYIYDKATCDDKAYDPVENVCYENKILSIEVADTCQQVIYDSRDYFCSASNKVVEKCNGEVFDADSMFCYYDKNEQSYIIHERCGGREYDFKKFECEDGMALDYCGEQVYNAFNVECGSDNTLWPRIYDHIVGACPSVVNPITGICEDGYCGLFDKSGKCVECQEGYGGEDCKYKVLCVNGEPGFDDVFRGHCKSCDAGYYGENCDKVVTCAHGTPDDGIYGHGFCNSCEAGYYGGDCGFASKCVNGVPDDGRNGSDRCKACDDGWAGAYCDQCASGYSGENCDVLQ